MLWPAMAAMAAVGPMQYGYAALAPSIARAHGVSPAEVLLPLAVWLTCQAAVALPATRLLSRGVVGVRVALWLGALLCALAIPSLTAPGIPLLVGYGLLGGTGAGLVYAACTETIARWHPERPGVRVAFVTGAYSCSALPLAFDLRLWPVMAGFGLAAIAWAAAVLRTPPANWWPPEIDPRAWALDRRVLHRQPRAARQFSLGEAVRTPTLVVLTVILVGAGAVAIFDVIALAFLGPTPPWLALAVLLAVTGAGRAAAVPLAERFGRVRVLASALALLALAQGLLAVAAAVAAASMVAVVAAVPAGLGGGAIYPLIAALVREYFGEDRVHGIHGLVYTAKAIAGPAGVGLAIVALPGLAAGAGAPVFVAATLIAATTALLCTTLRRPGVPATLPAPSI
ncbi:OFA family MFS transporter [Herbidospora galbida]|uniref:OFA family MFS transporter n=1 Tax=Herbidospora galbida TaxID=2575442 RepID=A0A4U3MLH7_9ACTN|nr:OFA family MFS transporter [Herbidospora galbida]TKK89629.1 OFA family MFS transporter [Herbidospora galbida]